MFIQFDDRVSPFELFNSIGPTGVPVTRSTVQEWHQRAAALASEIEPLTAFALFADVEDEFEPIEREALDLASRIDYDLESQAEINAASE